MNDMTFFNPHMLIVIPLYNHGRTVFEVINQCLEVHDRILVVNDGSTDLDESLVATSPVRWIHHGRNKGKGAAILTAAGVAAEEGFSHIITIDADLQHDPKDILKFKEAIQADSKAVFVGKRDFSEPLIPKMSRFGRQFSNFWFRVETGCSIGDAQSGFRAYPVFLFEHLAFSENHYSFEVEIIVKSVWAGVSVKDINISVTYPPPEKRVSHFKIVKDNLRLTHLNALLTFRSFLPIPHKKIISDGSIKFSIFKPLKSIRLFLSRNISPFQIALAGAAGVILGTLPLIALHTVVILLVAGYFRLNKFVAIGTSQICMPPLVPALCIEIGYFVTHGGTFLTDISYETLGHQAFQRVYEWLLGSLIVAPVLGLLSFVLIYVSAWLLSMMGNNHEH